ncbi:2-pyrone-4,6-dicarboxylate hydrolase [Salipaludibacillus neizhouensis]|uniref:2-pyrone-4,6-dicarboxylate hydrolase n=1 Tax=Salipaludibacillus neizhouensis TaxID=885475 RepID=A0A3A9KAZ0_9BACI|nr:amidohydrolase family protein [Salipaludibacillus neizhouensis]RKL69319.1 2-pyrone-4,6-dicarboxylate hydrolase [Salipaludibacillus neizhouensis]
MEIFDAHFHIIDPQFPLVENQGFLPDTFTSYDYLEKAKDLNIIGGALVSGSFQEYDQTYLLHALKILGPSFIGVTQLPYDTSDEKIINLDKKGVKAVRFNVKRGGSEMLARLDSFSRRVHDLAGWHTELYIDSRSLIEIASTLTELPAVSIDHLGLSRDGFSTLLDLVDHGVKVKATGFGRLDFNPEDAIREIYHINPEALMFGTDLPSTRAKRPFHHSDINLIYNVLDEYGAKKVLLKNAQRWYKK